MLAPVMSFREFVEELQKREDLREAVKTKAEITIDMRKQEKSKDPVDDFIAYMEDEWRFKILSQKKAGSNLKFVVQFQGSNENDVEDDLMSYSEYNAVKSIIWK